MAKDDRTTLGERLKAQRKRLQLTLAEVGDALGLRNGNFIGMVERGERTPSDARLLDLARILELDGREMVALKYEGNPGSAVGDLLGPPPPELPRIRRFLLETCRNKEQVQAEFERGDRTAIERVVFQALLEYVVLPGARLDRQAPRWLRARVAEHDRRLRADPTLTPDPWWFEQEYESFVEWARGQFQSWSFELPTLTLRIFHGADDRSDVSTLPLVDRELRDRMLHSVRSAAPGDPEPTTLPELLRAEGLDDDDVEEIVAMVELKKRRASRRTA